MRPSPRQRERTLHKLQTAYVAGVISADTLESRAAVAYGSRSLTELSRLVRDIPSLLTQLRDAYETFFWPEAAGEESVASQHVALPSRRGERIVLGRHPSCDVVLDRPSVSRRHLAISFDGHRWEARDLGSSNGTLLNGHHMVRALTAPGDVFELGESVVHTSDPGL